jgi:hypothetical protein
MVYLAKRQTYIRASIFRTSAAKHEARSNLKEGRCECEASVVIVGLASIKDHGLAIT